MRCVSGGARSIATPPVRQHGSTYQQSIKPVMAQSLSFCGIALNNLDYLVDIDAKLRQKLAGRTPLLL